MSTKNITLGSPVTALIDNTMDTVKNAVVSTMGPNGQLALISIGAATKTTKDGVTVARSIRFEDEAQELINRVITEPALKTDKECGDGTTTTILLTHELYQLFKKFRTFGERQTLQMLVNHIIERLTAMAIKVDTLDPRLYQVAMTSANQDTELAGMVARIYAAKDGYPEIELKEGQSFEDQVESTTGRSIFPYYSNPVFGKGRNGGELHFTEYTPIVVDARLDNIDPQSFALAVQAQIDKGIKLPLVIIARNIEQDANGTLVKLANHFAPHYQHPQGALPVIGMNTGRGGASGSAEMQDLAVMLGAPLLTDLDSFGEVVVEDVPRGTLVTGGNRSVLMDLEDEALARIEEQAVKIEELLATYTLSERYSVRGRLTEKRVRTLRGRIITILVGGETNSEIKERIDRYEDVVKAVRSALENGILPGGGTALMKATAEVLRQFQASKPDEETVEEEAERLAYERPFVEGLTAMALAGHMHLFSDLRFLPSPEILYTLDYLENATVIDLANDEVGKAEDLGVFDTAYAAITALKGGLQTAKILANTKTLLLGSKLHQVGLGK
ncbi:60 kDa chaperonin 1 [compost metagenome]